MLLIRRFPEPPLSNPQDLEDLKTDVELLQQGSGSSLKLEDEVRSRIVTKLTLYHVPSKPKMMRMPDRKCPCCLTETPSFIALCLYCHAEFWSAGKYARVIPEGEAPKIRWDREKINRAAKEAYRKAQEMNEKMSDDNKTRIQEDEKEIEKNAEEFGERQRAQEAKEDKTENKSFVDDDNQNIPQQENEEFEDLSMFERDLRLPEEGAMCIDSNLQAAKYMIIYLMKRVNKGINTWWKFNITTPRKEKLKLWEQGNRPDVTGGEYPPHTVDPSTGEPTPLEGMEILERLRSHGKHHKHVHEGSEGIIIRAYEMDRFIHKLRWAIYRKLAWTKQTLPT